MFLPGARPGTWPGTGRGVGGQVGAGPGNPTREHIGGVPFGPLHRGSRAGRQYNPQCNRKAQGAPGFSKKKPAAPDQPGDCGRVGGGGEIQRENPAQCRLGGGRRVLLLSQGVDLESLSRYEAEKIDTDTDYRYGDGKNF